MKGSIFRKVTGVALTAAMILTTAAVPSFAYIERGDVEIGGNDNYTLEVGETAKLSITPYAEEHMQGCGMADCPDVCGEKDCIVYVNGQPECVCAGTDMIMFYADVTASSSDDSVATAEYDDNGKVVITAVGEGTADIDIEAAFREYNTAEKTVSVTVKAASTSNSGDSGSSGSGDSNKNNTSSGDNGNKDANDNGNKRPASGGGGGGGSASSAPVIDEPKTPAAAAPVSGEVARAVSFSVRTYNTNRTEDGQTIEISLVFDRPVKVESGAENDLAVKIAGSALNESPNTENGASNRKLSVKASDTDDKTLIITIGCVPGAQFVKQTNASISVQAAASGVSHILTADTNEPVDPKYISTVIPSGIVLGDAGSTGSSVTKQVTHRANVRSMVYIQLLKNGKPVVSSTDHEGSYVIHAHAFINTPSGGSVLSELTEADYARLIAEGFTSFATNHPELAGRYTVTADGDKVTFTDTKPEGTETLDLRLYEYPVAGAAVSSTPVSDAAAGGSCCVTPGCCGTPGCTCGGTGECTCGGAVTGFTDVPSWAIEYVNYLANKGILNGRGPNTFAPDENVTRAEFVKIMAVASGEAIPTATSTGFSDVKSGAWYASYVDWASKKGIVTGNSDGTFCPQACITRQDIAVMLQRYGKATGRNIPEMENAVTFSDSGNISTYACNAVTALQRGCVVSGDVNGNFYPKSNATRAQAAKMVALFMQVTGA